MKGASPEPGLLTVREAAERLHCSEANVYALIDRGDLPFVRVGHAKGYRIDPADLAGFIESRKQVKDRAKKRLTPPRPRLKHIKFN